MKVVKIMGMSQNGTNWTCLVSKQFPEEEVADANADFYSILSILRGYYDKKAYAQEYIEYNNCFIRLGDYSSVKVESEPQGY